MPIKYSLDLYQKRKVQIGIIVFCVLVAVIIAIIVWGAWYARTH